MKKFSHLFFDCDGVILNSNKIKTKAFYKIGLQFGESEAKKLVDYHLNNGGVSRYKKINFFQKSILLNEDRKLYNKLVLDYGNTVKQDLLKTEISKGIFEIRKYFPRSNLSVVSGSDQNELRWVFKKLGIYNIFNIGIFGSPDSKEQIFKNLFEKFNNYESGIFFGDSKYDYQVSKLFNIDFVFMSDWSDLENWGKFIKENEIRSNRNISEFLREFDSKFTNNTNIN